MDLWMAHFKSNCRLKTTNNVVLRIVRSKDGKILSKFWGDEDIDATDSTLEPDTDHKAHKSNCQSSLEQDIDTDGNLKETHSADQYLLQHSHEDGFIKPGRKGRKAAAKTLDGNSIVRVSTRHKKTSVRHQA